MPDERKGERGTVISLRSERRRRRRRAAPARETRDTGLADEARRIIIDAMQDGAEKAGRDREARKREIIELIKQAAEPSPDGTIQLTFSGPVTIYLGSAKARTV
jgi:hypothetical protein